MNLFVFVIRAICFFILVFPLGITYAAERELAADGNAVRLTISNSYRCGSDAAIKITTASAAYFDQDALTIQRLSDTARAILSFECPNISKIKFSGYTDGIVVFKADALKKNNWALETEPAPLEGLALFFSLYDPDFFYLGAVSEQLKPYKKVSGIAETYQYKAYEKQISRMISIIDGNTKHFRSYLNKPGRDFGSFEKLLAHYANILKTIEIYAPNHYPAYNKVYAEVSSSLKNDYWSGRVAKLVEDDDKTVAEIVTDAVALTKTSPSAEFTAFVDTYVASWISEEANFIKDTLGDAPLYEIAWASEYIAGFPDPAQAGTLSKTKTLIQELPAELLPLITQRTEELQTLAVNMIQETGTSYADVDTILETGFALAGEFEEAGFVDQGQFLIATTINHIDNVLSSGLQNYRNELSTIKLTGETAAALQEQALVFDELSAEFEGFTAYKDAVEDTLNSNKGLICKSVLQDAGVNPREYMKRISLGNSQITLIMFSCDLFANQHVVTEFKPTKKKGIYVLSIDEADGEQNRFILKADNASQGQGLRILARFENEPIPMTGKEWLEYITKLVSPPPSGRPDADGVRECDKLAADPYDPQKLASGIDFEKEDVDLDVFDRALDACIAAVENDPDDARQQFQLGRLLWYAGDQEMAGEYINLAAAANYAPALYYQAEMLLGTSDDQDAFIDALDMFEASGKGGYARGNAMVKELNPDGIDFFKEIPPPSSKDLIGAFPKTHVSQTFFGVTASASIVDVKIKDCFQTSATDFSCEYRKILKCGMSGGNDPILRFMSWAQQKDCDTTQYTFGSFRKLGEGKWKELPNK